jgi:hypothetical protein
MGDRFRQLKDLRIIYSYRIVLILIACFAGGPLFAFGGMTPDEVITLLSGNTVDGERRDGGTPGIDVPDKIENFSTPFSMYFGSDGILKMKTGGKPKTGKWRVSGDAELCMEWKGKKEKCAPIHKAGNVYKRIVRRRSGIILFEHTYIDFTRGNKYDL